MANWAEAFQTLGKGLGALGAQRLDLEARRIETLRQEAISKINREHDVTMAERREEHDVKMETKRETHDTAEAVASRAQAKELFEKGEAADTQRQRESLGAQSALLDKRTVADAIENANQSYTQHLVAIQKSRSDLSTKKAEMFKDATLGFADEATIKAITDPMDAMLADLDRQEDVAKQTHILTTRRIHAGGYGKTEVLTPDDVRKIIGSKGPNDIPTRPPTGDVVTGRANEMFGPASEPGAQPAAAPRMAPAPAQAVSGAPAAQPVANELFPAKEPAAAPPMGLLELIVSNQKAVEASAPKKPSLGEAFSSIRSHLAANDKRIKAEQEAKLARDKELRMAVR